MRSFAPLVALYTSALVSAQDEGWRALRGRNSSLTVNLQPACSEEVRQLLTDTSGSIIGQGGPPGDEQRAFRVCKWRIFGNPDVNAINFRVDFSTFHGPDRLLIFSTQDHLLAEFSAKEPLPAAMSMMRSNQALLVLVSSSRLTRFGLSYSSHVQKSNGMRNPLFPDGMSLSRFMLLTGVIICCLVFVCIPACFCWFWRSGTYIDRVYDESAVTSHGQHTSQMARAVKEDNWIMGKLDELPSASYEDAAAKMGEAEECVLCLETYAPEDPLRVLPCKHYFHKACIDHWFEARRFRSRSCPICRGNPLAERDKDPPAADVDQEIQEADRASSRASSSRTSIGEEPPEDTELPLTAISLGAAAEEASGESRDTALERVVPTQLAEERHHVVSVELAASPGVVSTSPSVVGRTEPEA
mmetsp:Transcript_22396/g.39422  ORF Transcript_22396/g.39422 Transcript_22396/m.39422 type:complete len:414 (+) Transcript_22396:50-1291(+)